MNRKEKTQLPTIDPAVVRLVAPNADLAAIFCERARRVGLKVTETPSDSVAATVAELVQSVASDAGVNKPNLMIEPSSQHRSQIEAALGDDAVLLDPHAGDDAMFAADVGITGVHAAIAETGSLVVTSGDQLWRGLSLIPPAHIAVVHQNQIVPDLIDFLTGLPDAELTANLTLISGPSKTADIEGILITGVHGPGEVHVVVIREPNGGDNPST